MSSVQPFDVEGQLPVEINFSTQCTIENFSLREGRATKHRGSAKGIIGISVGLATPFFSFQMPILASPQLTELNTKKLISSLPKAGQKFTMSVRNSLGARITLIGCKLAERAYHNNPLQGEAGADFSGPCEEVIES